MLVRLWHVFRFVDLPVGSEQWIRYRVLFTAPDGAEVRSEWCEEASCTVARAHIRAVSLSSAEAFTLNAVLDGHADIVASFPCAGFEVQCAASTADLAAAAFHRVTPPPVGETTVVHRWVTE